MKIRSGVYWGWIDPTLTCRSHSEILDGGICIDVQVRISKEGATQLFIGVYAASGMTLLEESFDFLPATMTVALAWGVDRARGVIYERYSKIEISTDKTRVG